MKITILNENIVGQKNNKVCLAEWGLSAFIQINKINILFDTGQTNVYWQNAKQLKINLNSANFVVLSHYHWDHTGGLRYHNFKEKKKLIIHPLILEKLPEYESIKIKNDFHILPSEKSLEFSKNIFYLGEIPRENNFESGMYKNDTMLDDSALAIKTKNGVIVISGCSHSGICNICEYAKKITGQKLYAVLGGFHLFENNQKAVKGTIKYFQAEKPKYLYPMHCVDFPTLSLFHSVFKIVKISTGDSITL